MLVRHEHVSGRAPREQAVIHRPAVADYPPGAHLPTRVIRDWELVWMLRGRARLTVAGGPVALVPGTLALIPPTVAHGFAWDEAGPSRHGYVHFDAARLGAAPPAQVQVRAMTAHDPLAGLCAYLLWLGAIEHRGRRRRATETLRLLLSVLADGPLPATAAGAVPPPALDTALAHLRHRWSEPPFPRVTVADLATAGSVSRGYLGRLFRQAFGLGPAGAMERARCSRAEALLTRTDLPIETVARQCGFAGASHLSHRFTAVEGVSPRAYRAAGGAGISVLDDAGVRRLARLVWE